ncbi:unnamed protein product, partial [Prorocentrum cordatum]
VLAFGSLGDYGGAVEDGRASGCHLMVQCDPYAEGCEDCEPAALRALAPGGLLARLGDDGDGVRPCVSTLRRELSIVHPVYSGLWVS